MITLQLIRILFILNRLTKENYHNANKTKHELHNFYLLGKWHIIIVSFRDSGPGTRLTTTPINHVKHGEEQRSEEVKQQY